MDKQAIYDFLTTIPKGKVVTYRQIGAYFGNLKLARAIGNILHQNPDGDQHPCYKVVSSNGMLSEHYAFGGLQAQKQRLIADGIIVENNRVDLGQYGYLP